MSIFLYEMSQVYNLAYFECSVWKLWESYAVLGINMNMDWPLKPAPKFSLTIINVYKIKIAVANLAYFSLFIRSAWDWKAYSKPHNDNNKKKNGVSCSISPQPVCSTSQSGCKILLALFSIFSPFLLPNTGWKDREPELASCWKFLVVQISLINKLFCCFKCMFGSIRLN